MIGDENNNEFDFKYFASLFTSFERKKFDHKYELLISNIELASLDANTRYQVRSYLAQLYLTSKYSLRKRSACAALNRILKIIDLSKDINEESLKQILLLSSVFYRDIKFSKLKNSSKSVIVDNLLKIYSLVNEVNESVEAVYNAKALDEILLKIQNFNPDIKHLSFINKLLTNYESNNKSNIKDVELIKIDLKKGIGKYNFKDYLFFYLDALNEYCSIEDIESDDDYLFDTLLVFIENRQILDYTTYNELRVRNSYIVSDIHSHLNILTKSLDKLGYDENYDRLIIVGDITDQGPDNPEDLILYLLKNPKNVIMMGNHDLRVKQLVDSVKPVKTTGDDIDNGTIGSITYLSGKNGGDINSLLYYVHLNPIVKRFYDDTPWHYWYELGNLVLTHGYLPQENYYAANEKEFEASLNYNGLEEFHNNFQIKNKTLVVGHIYSWIANKHPKDKKPNVNGDNKEFNFNIYTEKNDKNNSELVMIDGAVMFSGKMNFIVYNHETGKYKFMNQIDI